MQISSNSGKHFKNNTKSNDKENYIKEGMKGTFQYNLKNIIFF